MQRWGKKAEHRLPPLLHLPTATKKVEHEKHVLRFFPLLQKEHHFLSTTAKNGGAQEAYMSIRMQTMLARMSTPAIDYNGIVCMTGYMYNSHTCTTYSPTTSSEVLLSPE